MIIRKFDITFFESCEFSNTAGDFNARKAWNLIRSAVENSSNEIHYFHLNLFSFKFFIAN